MSVRKSARQLLDREVDIQSWIQSVEISNDVETIAREGPPTKRARHQDALHCEDDDDDTFDPPYNALLPDTPPVTMSDASGSRKRGADDSQGTNARGDHVGKYTRGGVCFADPFIVG